MLSLKMSHYFICQNGDLSHYFLCQNGDLSHYFICQNGDLFQVDKVFSYSAFPTDTVRVVSIDTTHVTSQRQSMMTIVTLSPHGVTG